MHCTVVRARQQELVLDIGACWTTRITVSRRLRVERAGTDILACCESLHSLKTAKRVAVLLGCRYSGLRGNSWSDEQEPINEVLVTC